MASLAAAGILCLATSAEPFQNLGFDSVDTSRLSPEPALVQRGTGPTEDLLPGWQLSMGTKPQPTLGLNLELLTYGYCTLVDAAHGKGLNFEVEGGYALHIVGLPGNQEPFSLSQRGEIPADADRLSYRYTGYPFLIQINGAALSPILHTSTMEAFDISAFSGQTVELTLNALGPLMPTSVGSSVIDSVAFAVPEPSTWALLLSAAGWALAFGKRLGGSRPQGRL